MNRCKDCKWWEQLNDIRGNCLNEFIKDSLCRTEWGEHYFQPVINFSCILFESRDQDESVTSK
jgi:hypothetical protein